MALVADISDRRRFEEARGRPGAPNAYCGSRERSPMPSPLSRWWRRSSTRSRTRCKLPAPRCWLLDGDRITRLVRAVELHGRRAQELRPNSARHAARFSCAGLHPARRAGLAVVAARSRRALPAPRLEHHRRQKLQDLVPADRGRRIHARRRRVHVRARPTGRRRGAQFPPADRPLYGAGAGTLALAGARASDRGPAPRPQRRGSRS